MLRKIKIYIYEIIIACFVLACLVFGTSAFMRIEKKLQPSLSSESISKINKDITRIDGLVGVIVVSTDIAKNSRKIVYMNIFDPVVKKAFENFFRSEIITDEEPLFVHNGDEINSRTVRLINHEFNCAPFSSSIGSKFVPDVSNRIVAICSVSIPPSFGEFNGILSVYLNKEPTEEQKSFLRFLLRDISNEIAPDISGTR